MKRNKNSNDFPEEKNIQESRSTRPKPKARKEKTWNMKEKADGSFEVPEEQLEEFQRPEVVKLQEIGDFIHGYYEGLQPVRFQTGQMGYLILFRQGKQSTDKLLAINAGFDIQRWLAESGFDSMIGEYLKITLDDFVETGKPAPMKIYRYGYTTKVGKQLQSGAHQTLAQLEARYDDGKRILQDAEKSSAVEVWQK